ncbi:MAG: hypothetical protein AABX65_00395 [Nanoarchaeota archaeon]
MERRESIYQSLIWFLSIVVAFIFGGTGLGILYNSKGELVEIIGGFVLIGIAIAIVGKLIKDGR